MRRHITLALCAATFALTATTASANPLSSLLGGIFGGGQSSYGSQSSYSAYASQTPYYQPTAAPSYDGRPAAVRIPREIVGYTGPHAPRAVIEIGRASRRRR